MSVLQDYLWVFLIGGAICAIGQLLIDYTKLTPARILVAFVIIGVVLGGIGVYDPLVELAGAGATVPLTGFGYLLAKGVKTAVLETGLTGAVTGGFNAASAGMGAAIFFSLLVAFFFNPHKKKQNSSTQAM